MCGIAGIFAYRESAPPVDEAELLRTREAMAKRGPDGAGLWVSPDRRVGLAHRRLAIIDLSEAGAQPMASADGRLVVTFNGEIYNYRELRKELEAKGYRFRSNSDTEVLLQLYAERGAEMVHALRGMFAFGIWDAREQTLFLARDPFGIKPLYYADGGATLRFASQVKALVAGGAIGDAPEPAGHVGFFTWGSVPEPFTLYKQVRAIPAGTHMTVSGARRTTAYFSIAEEFAKARQEHRGAAAEQVADALRDSVRHHMIADVPVGVFLSAGLDSGTVTALAAEDSGSRLRTLTLGFREHLGTENDETPLAGEVSLRYGAVHETRWITRGDFESELPRILAAMDQPSIDGVNTYFVSKAAAESGLKVAISGLGGDELLGGYPSFQDVPRLKHVAAAFGAVPMLGRAFRYLSFPLARRFTSPKYSGVLEYGGSYAGAYLLRRGLFMPWELSAVMDPAFAAQGWEELQPLAQLGDTIAGMDDERQIVAALELAWYMRNQLLRDADWAGMAHSLEIRVPYIDVPFLRRVGPELTSGRAPTKAALARALRPPLPDALINRAKTGFVVPVREWCGTISRGYEHERGLRGWARFVMRDAMQTAGLAFPAKSAASPGIDPPSGARRTVHRVQAALMKEVYRGVNALLAGCAALLWRGPRPATAERVCVFRIGNIGDIACALPAIRCVRQAYPNARFTLLTSPGAEGMPGAAELLTGAEWVDELRVYHADDIETLPRRWSLLEELRAQRFDVWIEIPNNLSPIFRQFRDMVFTRATGVKWARGWCVDTIPLAAQAQSEHLEFANEVDRTLNVVRRAGIPVAAVEFGLPRPPSVQARIDGLVRLRGLKSDALVAIAPGAKRSTNLWPPERFVEVGRTLAKYGCTVVLVGGAAEAELCKGLATRIGAHAWSLAGELSIPESCELLRRCRLLIAVDSGVQHLAAAVGTPCVSLFSFWQMRGKWHPHGDRNVVLQKWVPCHTCLLEECPNGNQCMKAIEAEEVVGHAAELLHEGRGRAAAADSFRPATAPRARTA